ncbi:phosphonoacetaldehyde hydrolase [Clostridium paraputrificum]|uniref:phosphonoacetaldehyde hydrolase n=1 Tax=Clostridium TaxID=1485 RepID=UPI003D358D0C
MKIQGVIFDWAGTTIDYGCFSPVEAFMSTFKTIGIDLTFEEAREPMGMLKIDHTRALLTMDSVKERFNEIFKRYPNEGDVKELYSKFEPILFETLKDYVKLNPYVKETVDELKRMGIKIGSTTGYTKKMMSVIIPIAKNKGYFPEVCIASDELGYGRPYPYMIYENARKLNIYPQKTIVKVGDTVVDMKEGVNAGTWTVGIVLGSSELGLTYEEVEEIDMDELYTRMELVRKKLYAAGADYVIDDMSGLIPVIEEINEKLA